MDELLRRPLRLPPNRVYRFYRGGALMDRFRGAATPEDTVFPAVSYTHLTLPTN